MNRKEKELTMLWQAPIRKRYRNFIHTAADRNEVWMLGSPDGELQVEGAAGFGVCIWPRREFAERFLCETNISESCVAFVVEAERFAEHLCSLSEREGCYVAVFPTPQNLCMTAAKDVLRDLTGELELYE